MICSLSPDRDTISYIYGLSSLSPLLNFALPSLRRKRFRRLCTPRKHHRVEPNAMKQATYVLIARYVWIYCRAMSSTVHFYTLCVITSKFL